MEIVRIADVVLIIVYGALFGVAAILACIVKRPPYIHEIFDRDWRLYTLRASAVVCAAGAVSAMMAIRIHENNLASLNAFLLDVIWIGVSALLCSPHEDVYTSNDPTMIRRRGKYYHNCRFVPIKQRQ